jgi:uncharacterized membrane protein
MNAAHLHLLVNHLPILLPFLGCALLAAGYLLRSDAIQRTALVVLVVGTLSTPLAMFTGEKAEESLESQVWWEEAYAEHHEEVAERYAVSSYVLGALALVAWVAHVRRRWAPNRWVLAVAVAALPTLFFATRAGLSGGEIRHTEIRPDASYPADQVAPAGGDHAGGDHAASEHESEHH